MFEIRFIKYFLIKIKKIQIALKNKATLSAKIENLKMSKVRYSQGDKENQNFNSPKKLKRNTTNENLVLSSSNNLLSSTCAETNSKLIDPKGK